MGESAEGLGRNRVETSGEWGHKEFPILKMKGGGTLGRRPLIAKNKKKCGGEVCCCSDEPGGLYIKSTMGTTKKIRSGERHQRFRRKKKWGEETVYFTN